MSPHPARYCLSLLAALSLLLTGCTGGSSADTEGKAFTTDPLGASDSTTEGGKRDGPLWKLLAAESDGVLQPGTYGLTANGVSNHVAVIRAPEGYQNLGGWTFVTGKPFHAMGFMTADLVPPDPCGTGRRSKFDAEVDPGTSVQDLADALVAQKGDAASEPIPVMVDGYRGLYLNYRVPKGIDVATCEAGAYDIFSTGPGSWWLKTSRERAAIWILDVDGERLVLGWVAVPGVTRAQMREMTRMAESARFVMPG